MLSSNRLLLVLPLLLPAGALFGGASETPAQDTAAHQDDDEGLSGPMSRIQRGMRNLGKSLRAADGREDSLKAVEWMRTGLVASLSHAPHFPAEMTDATEQQRFRIAYQRKIAETLDATLQLEDALYSGDKDAAMAQFAALRELKSAGHDRFQLEEEDH